MIATPTVKHPESLEAFRISPGDTNYFACLADPLREGVPFTVVYEIYQAGGATPPNVHRHACEFFAVLAGTGRGRCNGEIVDLAPGSTLLIPPGTEHVIENTGAGKLYVLCVMVPNEAFAEMIRRGTPVELTAEDIEVLSRRSPEIAQ